MSQHCSSRSKQQLESGTQPQHAPINHVPGTSFFSDKVDPAPIYDINFYKDISKDKLGEREPRGRPLLKANEQQKESFLMMLAASSPSSVGLSNFK